MFRFCTMVFFVILVIGQTSCTPHASGGSGELLDNPLTSDTPAQFNYSDTMLHWENSHEVVFRDSDYTPKSQAEIAAAYRDYAQWIARANVQNLLVRVPGPECVVNEHSETVLPGVDSFEILAKDLEKLGWGGVLWFTPDTIEAVDSWDCWVSGTPTPPAPLDSWKTYVDVLKSYNETLINNSVPANYIFHGLLLEPEASSFEADFETAPEKYGWGTRADSVGSYLLSQGFSRWTGDPWSTVPTTIAPSALKIGYGIGADQLKSGTPTITVSGIDADMLVLETYNLDYLEPDSTQKPSTLIASIDPGNVADEYQTILSSYPTQSNSIYANPEVVASINAGEIVFAFSYEQYISGAAEGVFGNQGWSAQNFATMLIAFRDAMIAAHSYSSLRTGVYHQPEKEILPACNSSIENCYKGFRPRYTNDWGN